VRTEFAKYEGAGNDFILIDNRGEGFTPDPRLIARLCDRHFGIGADGVMTLSRSAGTDCAMRYFNADGSEAMMCGNASRCIGKYIYEKGLTTKTSVRLQTLSGVKTLHLHLGTDGSVESVTVDMLKPAFHVPEQYDETAGDTLTAAFRTFRGTFVSMGNPHFVCFVDDIKSLDIARFGSILETDVAFPQRCNIEFAQVMPDGSIRTRVWERGVLVFQVVPNGHLARFDVFA
jgi:diaminopimelate epimerase